MVSQINAFLWLMQTRLGKAHGYKITDSYLTETKMNLSIAFQSLQTPELNGRHTIVCDLKHFIKEQTLRNVSKGKYFTLKKVTKDLNFHFFFYKVCQKRERGFVARKPGEKI